MATERDLPVPASRLSSTRPGTIVTIEEGGLEYRARVLRVEGATAIVRAFERLECSSESTLHLTLVQALPGREKMALILEKATELGVHRFVPCVSAKSENPAVSTKGQNKSHRWARVVQKAVEQCRRRAVPKIAPVRPFSEAIRSLSSLDALKLILYEREKVLHLRDLSTAGERPGGVVLVCGPEGGFTEGEVRAAEENGFTSIRLGGRILRCETASIAAVSIIQHLWGDL